MGLLLRGRREEEWEGKDTGKERGGKGLRGGKGKGKREWRGVDIAWPTFSLVYATPLLQHQTQRL